MLMRELQRIVGEKINKGEVIKLQTPCIDISFRKDEIGDLEVTIFRQGFSVTTFPNRQVISTYEGFKIVSVLKAEIMNKDTLAVAGLVDIKFGKFPIRKSGKVEDMADYVTRALVSISMITLDDTTKNVEHEIKKITNSISQSKIYHICEVCGASVDEHTTLCDSCKERYIPCAKCGNYHFKEEMYEYKKNYYCDVCLSSDTKSVELTSYSTKVSPKFFGSQNHRFYGVEIEVERNNKAKFSEDKTISILNKYSECSYYKHDGSLRNGFEWITHPCTIDYHRENVAPVLSMLEKLGYGTSSGRCGLHIHVSKKCFGKTQYDVEHNIGRLLWLQHHFREEFESVSKRINFEYCGRVNSPSESTIRSCRELLKSFGEKTTELLGDDTVKEVIFDENNAKALAFYKACLNQDRYKAINIKNPPTVEFRLPQGTMSVNNFLAYLYLYDRMISIACDDLKFTDYSFKDLFKGVSDELDILIDETL